MISPILIATKGRAGFSKTIANLAEEKVPAFLFVEPQDEALYKSEYPNMNIVTLPINNGGIGYVRQFILMFARENSWDYYWTLDDDISAMYEIIKGKSVKSTFRKVLSGAEKLLTSISNLAIGGLEYNQFAWSAKKKFAFNGYCEVATFVNVNHTRITGYRTEANLKEDRDFVLQNLANGYVSARTTQFAFAAPKNGSNKGGLYDEYKAGKEKAATERFAKLWPGIVTPHVKKDGRPDAKINWRVFKNEPVFKEL